MDYHPALQSMQNHKSKCVTTISLYNVYNANIELNNVLIPGQAKEMPQQQRMLMGLLKDPSYRDQTQETKR